MFRDFKLFDTPLLVGQAPTLVIMMSTGGRLTYLMGLGVVTCFHHLLEISLFNASYIAICSSTLNCLVLCLLHKHIAQRSSLQN